MGQGSEKDEGNVWIASTPSIKAEPNSRARRRPNPFSSSTIKLREEDWDEQSNYNKCLNKKRKRSLNFNVEKVEVEVQRATFKENRSGSDLKSLRAYERRRQKVTSCSNLQSVMSRKDGSRVMRPEELIDWLQKEREVLRLRVQSFIGKMQLVQGDRPFLPWKCSVVDSVVGAFLTQNVDDTLSSSAFMSLAAKYPRRIVDENKPPQKNFASSTSKSMKGTQASSAGKLDCVEWHEVISATAKEMSEAIRVRGMNKILAPRIKECLHRIADEQGSIDLECLRNVPPSLAKKYLMSIHGLGLKSVECVRLLTLKHLAFPVDRNVTRIVVRLGWFPIEPPPEGNQMHLLKKYPKEDSIQRYLWPRLCTFDHGTLYELHYHMITFGKVFCTESKPNCNACPMRVECKYFESKRRNTLREKSTSCSNSLITSLESMVECKQIYERDIENVVVDTSKAIGKTRKAASVSALVKMRTEHVVYELPNSHPLLERQNSEGPDCPDPYLLAAWTTGVDTSEGVSQKAEICSESTLYKKTAEQDREMVSGTLLIPCQRAMRGSFPLNGTYFQPNEVFADDESSRNPINVAWESIRYLTKKTLYCGTSVRNMLGGKPAVSTEKMQQCFREGFVCFRGFNREAREFQPLSNRFHLRKGKKNNKKRQ